MSIQLFDPLFDVEVVQRREEHRLESLQGKRVGYIFNQHVSALAFWKALELEVDQHLLPAATHRVYKTNTWAQAPQARPWEVRRVRR